MIKWLIMSFIHWVGEFSDPVAATMVGTKWINFSDLTCSHCSKLQSQTPSKIFLLNSAAASNWWLVNQGSWQNVHKNISQSLLHLRCSSLQQELKFLCFQCIWNLVWNNWIEPQAWSYHHAINLNRLDCFQCFAEKKLKI